MGWKGVGIVVAVLAAVVAFSIFDLSCNRGSPAPGSAGAYVRNEIAEGKRQYRILEIEKLSTLARDLRVLAKRYVEQGDKKKAQRAVGAAQELDRRIEDLRRANDEQSR